MHPVARYSTRFLTATFGNNAQQGFQQGAAIASRAVSAGQTPWTCTECRHFKLQTRAFQTKHATIPLLHQRRPFSAYARRREEDTDVKKPISPTSTATATSSTPHDPPTSTSRSLPSHVEKQRWQLSRDMTKFVDTLLARASIAGQHINVYTGTDYSGIEALRKDIIDQEQKVKDYHKAVEGAKREHHDSVAKQAASQKEIVSLLERKSSWSPTDLERYMSLVRFEHSDEQSVQVAKDSLAAAERQLEDARSTLEKSERKQYHEEQVWSDTIRRNSTWVTFGLMGVNIILLLAQILIFEPFRRRKIVRDVKAALDEKTLHHAPSPVVEKQVDEVLPPEGVAIEALAKTVEDQVSDQPIQPLEMPQQDEEDVGKAPLAASEILPAEAVDVTEVAPDVPTDVSDKLDLGGWQSQWDQYQARLRDLFSERIVQIKQVDLTTIALQGAATGVAAMGLLFVLLRPK